MASQSACSSLLPDEWREGVPGADLPAGSSVGDWIAFADAQTGQLEAAGWLAAGFLALREVISKIENVALNIRQHPGAADNGEPE